MAPSGPRRLLSTRMQGLPPGYVQERLNGDPSWQHFTPDERWICPFCLHTVRSSQRNRSALIRHIEGHLASRCSAFKGGSGEQHPAQQVTDRKQALDIEHRIRHDARWQVFDNDGYWYSPTSLECITHIRLGPERRVDNFVIQRIIQHTMHCPHFRQGVIHEVNAVRQRAIQTQKNRARGRRQPGQPTPSLSPMATPSFQTPASGMQQGQQPPVAKPAGKPSLSDYSSETPAPAPPTAPVSQTPPSAGPPVAPIATPTGGNPVLGDHDHQMRPRNPTASKTLSEAFKSITKFDLDQDDDTSSPAILPPRTPPAGSESLTPAPEQPAAAPSQSSQDDDHEDAFSWMEDDPSDPPKRERPSTTSRKSDTQRLRWMDDLESQAAEQIPLDNEERRRAGGVQLNMLGKVPEIPGYRFATRFQPCADVSGDFYEFVRLQDGRVGFAVGDVSGHGMEAGLIMSMAKKALAIFARQCDDPAEVLANLNDALAEDLQGRLFVTITYAILDPDTRSIEWARAGHNPTMVYNVHEREWREIKPPGMVVGMKAGPLFRQSIRSEKTSMRSGDLFLLYTDGITETMNAQRIVRVDESGKQIAVDTDREEEYGEERLQAIIEQFVDKDLDEVMEAVMHNVRQFRGGGDPQDDLTLLALQVE